MARQEQTKIRIRYTLYLLPLALSLQNCQSAKPPVSEKQAIGLLSPDERMLLAEERYQKNEETEWVFYTWSNTRLEELQTPKSREIYRLLKSRLFREPLLSPAIDFENLQVSAMLMHEDDLWLGTWNGGIFRYSLSSRKSFILEMERPTLIPKSISRIRHNYSAIWFTTFGGLQYYNFQNGDSGILPFTTKLDSLITDYAETKSGLYVATLETGLWHRDARGKLQQVELETLGPTVTTLEVIGPRSLAVGTPEGAYLYESGHLQKLPLAAGQDLYIHQAASNGEYIWFATSQGLLQWDRNLRLSQPLLRPPRFRAGQTIHTVLLADQWLFFGGDSGILGGYHLPKQELYTWNDGQNAPDNLEYEDVGAISYNQGKLYYTNFSGGVQQINWLAYLLSLRQKDSPQL